MMPYLIRARELLILAALGALAACSTPQPALQGVAVQNPLCVALCWAVTETIRDGAAGDVAFQPAGGGGT